MKLGISSCPNDIFIFAALLDGKIKTDVLFDVHIADVEELNHKALNMDLDIVKVSYGVVDRILDNYGLLTAGGAMGYGVGPLLLARDHESTPKNLAIPGLNTTAFKVFKILFPDLYNKVKDNVVSVKFDEIMHGVQSGIYDAGIVIHEGRFTYQNYKLIKIADLGEMWESKYNTPLPLGAIVIKRSISEYAEKINNVILDSMDYAYNNFDEIMPFVIKYADEMDQSVMKQHINLYVNKYSKNAKTGQDGISALLGVENPFII